MKLQYYLCMGLCVLLFEATSVFGAMSAQDNTISVNPVVNQFPVTVLGKSSNPALFTIANKSASVLSLGTMSLGGVNAAEFTLGATDCTASLAAGASCTVAVSFTPASKGTKSAYLQIPSSAVNTPVLTAFLTNYTSADVESQRRVPPVLSAVSISETMSPGSSQTFTWTLEGYDAAYGSYISLFDCTGITDGSCGGNANDPNKFAESTIVMQSTSTPGNWTYSGARTKLFDYSWNYTIPATRPGGGAWATSPGTEIVIRMYVKSDIDATRNNASVSLLIPGNQAATYYDTLGRRIVKRIVAP